MDTSLPKRLAHSPVIATLYGAEQLGAFLKSAAGIAIVANIELRRLQPVLAAIAEADKYAIVNIDSCDGLSQDRGGVDFLADVGAKGIVSTRVATIQRARRSGLLSVQKVFVTDRSTLPRSLNAIQQSEPNLVQLMPAPMLPHIPANYRKGMPPVVASGFVCNRASIVGALGHGAVAVSTSDQQLWRLTARELR